MEINITRFFNDAAPMDYSASVAEIGQGAGSQTWGAAVDDSAEYMMLDDDAKREAFRSYVQGFGAWEEDEIRSWDDRELNALFIQMIVGEIRESDLTSDSNDEDWTAYERRAEEGEVSGALFRGDDGEIYYYVGA